MKEIPIFFTTDDNYVPYLDVAILSLIKNASREYFYKIIILNTGLDKKNTETVKQYECENVSIDFVDISKKLKDILPRFKSVYHFSIVTYYRLFIASLFPEYDKILYLDCDLIVKGDISELYNIVLGENVLGAVPDQYVRSTSEFRLYAEKAVGVDPDTYFNAGVLVISLNKFREKGIENEFVHLITEHDFDLLDPDQAYLNYLCFKKTLILSEGWNKSPLKTSYTGEKSIVHYNLYKKPWQYDNVNDGELFWDYAKASHFYDIILQRKSCFCKKEILRGEKMAREILDHAKRIVASDNTFSKMLGGSYGG